MKNLFFILFLLLSVSTVFAQNPGDLDSGFGKLGKVIVPFDNSISNEMRSMVIRKDGKILLAGHKHTALGSSLGIVRLNKNGTVDSTFGVNGLSFTGYYGTLRGCQSMLLLDNGRIMVVGTRKEGNGNLSLMRFMEDGLLDTSFGTKGRLIYPIMVSDGLSMTLQKDGKILIAGSARFSDNPIILIRVHPNGDLDTGFTKNGIVSKPPKINSFYTQSIHLDKDGDIFIAGIVNDSFYGAGDFGVIKIKTDGSLDSVYGQGGAAICDFGPGFNDYIGAAALQSDGAMIVVGNVSLRPQLDKSSFAITRFTSKGTLDSSFGTSGKRIPDFGFGNEYAYDVTLQADKKIIIAGTNNSKVILLRIESNGRLDSSFGNNAIAVTDFGPNSSALTKCVGIQSGGNIIVALTIDGNFAAISYLSELMTDVQRISADIEIYSLYPNPCHGTLRISGIEEGYFTILDACGRNVLDGSFNSEIDLTSLQLGMYMIQLRDGDKVKVFRFFKS